MALIKCPDCERDVSNKAEKCIHCGYPLHQTADTSQNPEEIDSKNRINLDDPGYNPFSPSQVVVQNNKAKILWVILGTIAMIAIAIGIVIAHQGGNQKNNGYRLDGTYMAQTDFGLNGIYFMEDGHFARYSNITLEYGDWSLVTEGTYSLDGSTLTLYCSDGRVHLFYYDRSNDTMVQNGEDDIYYRQITG